MRVYSLLAVVVVLFTAFVIYQRSADQVTRTGGGSPQEQIDVTAIRQRC